MKICAIFSSWYPHYTSSSIGVIVYHVTEELKKKGTQIDICAPIGGNIQLLDIHILKATNRMVILNHVYRSKYFF